MATFYLTNTTTAVGTKYLAGEKLDDAVNDVASIRAAGGQLWESSNATIAAAAVIAVAARARGQNESFCDGIMAGAVAKVGDATSVAQVTDETNIATVTANLATVTTNLATVTASQVTDETNIAALQGQIIKKATVTITQAGDLSGIAATTFAKNLSQVLPVNARFVGVELAGFTGFDDATHASYTVSVGTSGTPTAIVNAANVAAGQGGFPKAGTAGANAFPGSSHSAETLQALITGGVNLNTATAGAITVNVFYFVPG